jgi:nucleoid-associated protein YgaU
MSPPLRWLAAVAVLAIVVVIAGALLIDTVSDTVQLSTGASEEPTEAAGAGSEQAAAPSEPEANGDSFPQNYTVQEGDTGTKISERFYNSDDGWSQIAEANDIDPSAPLRVGEELEIPAPE